MDTDYPGDPLTPGVASTKDAKRLALSDAKTITKIPVIPLSYADARAAPRRHRRPRCRREMDWYVANYVPHWPRSGARPLEDDLQLGHKNYL